MGSGTGRVRMRVERVWRVEGVVSWEIRSTLRSPWTRRCGRPVQHLEDAQTDDEGNRSRSGQLSGLVEKPLMSITDCTTPTSRLGFANVHARKHSNTARPFSLNLLDAAAPDPLCRQNPPCPERALPPALPLLVPLNRRILSRWMRPSSSSRHFSLAMAGGRDMSA